MAVTEQQVVEALKTVQDPDVFKDLVALNQVKSVKVFEGTVSVEISTASPQKERIRQQVESAIAAVPGVEEVFVSFSTSLGTAKPAAPAGGGGGHKHGPQQQQGPKMLPGVEHVIAVGAGKGGVGKSTVAVNLAVGLALMGKKVALLDGDIYGPSIPTLTGIGPRPPQVVGDRIVPFVVQGEAGGKKGQIAVMSIGFMVDKEKALIWRGPMAHGAMKQMIEQVEWGYEEKDERRKTKDERGEEVSEGRGVDFLIVDLPPGTGDVALTLAQTVPLTGAVVVATPQEVALADARRAVRMFQQLGVEILGVVENMSYFVCEHGTAYDIFGRGGAQVMAQEMGLAFLGEVPIDVNLRKHSDEGTPFANFKGEVPSSKPLMGMTDMLEKQVAIRVVTRPMAKAMNLQIT